MKIVIEILKRRVLSLRAFAEKHHKDNDKENVKKIEDTINEIERAIKILETIEKEERK